MLYINQGMSANYISQVVLLGHDIAFCRVPQSPVYGSRTTCNQAVLLGVRIYCMIKGINFLGKELIATSDYRRSDTPHKLSFCLPKHEALLPAIPLSPGLEY